MTAAGSAGEAVTPGQAAYEAYVMAAPDDLNFIEPDKLDDWEYPAWEAAAQAGHEQHAQAAIAAQQPPTVPDRSLLGLVDAHFIGDGPHPLQLVCLTEDDSDVECDTTIAEVEPGTEWDELERRIVAHAAECHATVPVSRLLVDVRLPDADLTQMHLTVPDTTPQPAPELAAAMRAQLAIATGALRDIKDSYDTGTAAHDWAHRAIDEIGGVEPCPPGEAEQLREQLGRLQDSIGNLAAGLKLSANGSRPSKKSEIEDGCAAALLGILDPR